MGNSNNRIRAIDIMNEFKEESEEIIELSNNNGMVVSHYRGVMIILKFIMFFRGYKTIIKYKNNGIFDDWNNMAYGIIND